MNDQQRSTPQPFDDGPRSAVDPHLLPTSKPLPWAADADPRASESTEPTAAVRDPQPEHSADPTRFEATEPEQPTPASELPESAAGATRANGDESHQRNERDTESGEASDTREVADSESGTTGVPIAPTTPRSRLDEAVERSRTIPYEAPEQPATSDTDVPTEVTAHAERTEVLETGRDGDYASRTPGASHEQDDLDAERRRDDAAFENAMLGTTSTEGLIVPPQKRGNRTFALIMAAITTVVFAALYAFAFAVARYVFTPGANILSDAWAFAGTAAFYVPVALFAVIMILWSVISNRAGWWSYVLASLFLGLVSFAGHYVGIAGQEVINGGPWSNQVLLDAIRAPENLPGALIAFIAARESSNWLGGLIAARGRRLTRLNQRDLDDYNRRVAEERELSGIASSESLETNSR